MKTKDEILAELPNFYGSEQNFLYNPVLFPNVLLTEGALFIAEECGAYWLMDVISSHLPSVRKAGDTFAVALLTKDCVNGSSALFALQDDVPPNVTYATQAISYTDFPLDEIKFYVSWDGKYWVILLTSEY